MTRKGNVDSCGGCDVSGSAMSLLFISITPVTLTDTRSDDVGRNPQLQPAVHRLSGVPFKI
jgi:hypothetical protein